MSFVSRPWKLRIIGLRLALLAAAFAVLGGCSAPRFIYNQAPDIVYWWLDGYADFDEAQAPVARRALAAWFQWHRRTQLPEYAALLEQARSEVRADLTAPQVCALIEAVRDRFDVAYAEGISQMAPIVPTLSADQVANVERRYAKANREFRDDFLQPTRDERVEQAVERTVRRTQRVYGKLNQAQRELVEQRLAASPLDADRWFADRMARQREVVDALKRHGQQPAMQDASLRATDERLQRVRDDFRAIGQRMRRSADRDYQAYEDGVIAYNCAFMADLHNTMSAAQRQTAAERFEAWAEDARALAAAR